MQRSSILAIGVLAFMMCGGPARAQLPCTSPAHGDMKGNVGGGPNAVDHRDDGSRRVIDPAQPSRDDDVDMSCLVRAGSTDQNTFHATLNGTIAHLQRRKIATMSETDNSRPDALGQRWYLAATFRAIGRAGMFGGGASVPYSNMVGDLRASGLDGGELDFTPVHMELSPLFLELRTPGGVRRTEPPGQQAWARFVRDAYGR